MSWNYRIVKYKDGTGYGLHEVFYDKGGQPTGMGERPASFGCGEDEDPESIHKSLRKASADAIKRPTLIEPDQWH
jgi:hypothetical protein